MKIIIALVVAFFFITPAIACSKPPIRPVIHEAYAQCEPMWISELRAGECTGTRASNPSIVDGACTCGNQAYIPIPNPQGFTCVHLVSVLETIRSVRRAIANAGIAESEADGPLVLDRDDRSANRIDLAILSKDLRWIDQHVRDSPPPKRFTQRIRYAQIILESYFRNPNACTHLPNTPLSRDSIFAEYPRVQ